MTGPADRRTSLWIGVLLASVIGAACGGSSGDVIDIDVSFDPGAPRSARDQAVRVEVYLVADCDEISTGERPGEVVASTFTLRDGSMGALVGEIDPGSYGLYALARDSECAVVAAGCVATAIGTSTAGPITVIMGAFSGPPCSDAEECVVETGECLGTGAMGGCVGQADDTACVTDEAVGVCRIGACCTGCWDGATCQPGTQTQQCGVGGETCAFVPGCKL